MVSDLWQRKGKISACLRAALSLFKQQIISMKIKKVFKERVLTSFNMLLNLYRVISVVGIFASM